MKQKLSAYALSIFVFAITFIIIAASFIYGTAIIGFYPPQIPKKLIFIYAALNLLIPITFATYLARKVFKKIYGDNSELIKSIFKNKIAGFTIAILYSVTIIAGIPATQSHNSNWAIDTYKDLKSANDPRVFEGHPNIKSHFSMPIFPFVLMTFHEYQLTGLYGWGGWDIQLWYVVGVKRIVRLPLWVS